jgi:hypothetical protein
MNDQINEDADDSQERPAPAVDQNFGAADPPAPPAALHAANKIIPTGAEMGTRGVQLRNLKELAEFSRMAFQSGLAPSAFKTPQAVAVAIQTGMEHGLTPLAALKAVYVVNGLPAWRGESALGLVRASGLMAVGSYRAWIEAQGDDMVACCQSQRVGESSVTTTFSVKDAKVAGLWGKRGSKGQDTPWITYPKRMLLWRAIAFHLKDVYPDVLGGAPIAEEAIDIEARARDAEPKKSLMASVAGPVSEDRLLAAAGVTVPDQAPQGTDETDSPAPAVGILQTLADHEPATGPTLAAMRADENRFANLLAALDDSEDFADLDRRTYRALTAAGENKDWQAQVKASAKKLSKKFPETHPNTRG